MRRCLSSWATTRTNRRPLLLLLSRSSLSSFCPVVSVCLGCVSLTQCGVQVLLVILVVLVCQVVLNLSVFLSISIVLAFQFVLTRRPLHLSRSSFPYILQFGVLFPIFCFEVFYDVPCCVVVFIIFQFSLSFMCQPPKQGTKLTHPSILSSFVICCCG